MTDDPGPVVVEKSNRTTLLTIASISGIFIVFIGVLWAAGFFKFTGSDPSSKVVAAALALVGGLVAAIVSVVGILLKYSIDQRTEARLAIEAARAAAERKIESQRTAAERKAESDRANALQTQAEQRLNLEAAIRAVELLGAEGGNADIQRAGALFALSNLDQHLLTLDLVSYLLQRSGLEPNIACSLLDRALVRGDEGVQRRAVNILTDNAERMVTQTDTSAPRCITNWDDCLASVYVREWAIVAMTNILLARPLSEWQKRFVSHAYAMIATFVLAWKNETDTRLKKDCTLILKWTLKAFGAEGLIYHPKLTVDTSEIAAAIASEEPETEAQQQTMKRFESWQAAVNPPADAPTSPLAVEG